MKKIEAIIKPFKLNDVKEALNEHRHPRHDRHRSQRLRPPERAYRNLSRQRIHRGFSAQNQNRNRPARRAGGGRRRSHLKAAKTGKIGDGKVFVSTIDDAWRIRTDERGDSAV